MQPLGANVAILDGRRVLLTLREDFEVWCLPGGHVDPGESFEAAAHREVREETGLEIELDGLVGTYSRPRWGDHGFQVAVFAARVTGGSLLCLDEVLDAAYFDPAALPGELMLGHRERILDAVAGRRDLERTSDVFFPFSSETEMLRARDASSLSRSAFYAAHIVAPNAAYAAA